MGMKIPVAFSLLLVSLAPAEDEKVVQGHVFAWPFTEVEKMQPRGGTTTGSKVVLAEDPSEAWKELQEAVPFSHETDRRAILALAGSYRVSFDFIETMGFAKDYRPPQPYFSWGTEHVHVLADEENFISLQHTLVMYFKNEDGTESGPMVMKHWRQDWTYEDTQLHTFRGNSTWELEVLKPAEVGGKWTQTVYQVDDSPRYEVLGEWDHAGGISVWRSDQSWRPLPRREFSVRDDYQVLAGTHEITVTPTGWVHTQQNEKVALEDEGRINIVARELGVNRYERIAEPVLASAAQNYWKASGPYWAEVRKTWAEVYQKYPTFSLKGKVDDKKLYQYHFQYASDLEKDGEEYDPESGRKHARETIMRFVEKGDGQKAGKY